MNFRRALAWILPLAVGGLAAAVVPWEDLTEGDWLYAMATRFTMVDGHRVHYPTPTAELAKLLEGRRDPAALRHLAEARLALGDRQGAVATLEQWAKAQGAEAWAETARWEMAHHEPARAFLAAEQAMPGLAPEARRALGDERIAWAQAHPDLADPIAMLKARADGFPEDPRAAEAWLRALEGAGRLAEADAGLAGTKALAPERRLLIRADLKADHGDAKGAFRLLDEAVAGSWSTAFHQAFAQRVGQAAPSAPGLWRATLDTRFEAAALTRLFTYFVGRNQPGLATDLLRQVERRYEKAFGPDEERLLARLYGTVDAVPEAFRAALAAAHLGRDADQTSDLAALAQLALRAGGRPLAWGAYNDAPYHWVAAVDRTPGFWTGGLSFLLTGVEWKETLERLESQSLPDRTFTTARALAATLAQRAPADPALPGLRAAIMARHVERGEGREALALLPLLENGPLADEGRRQALLAARQTAMPLAEEARLMKLRLREAAPDGSRPAWEGPHSSYDYKPWDSPDARAWSRIEPAVTARYAQLLQECSARLNALDGSHRAATDLLLTELDRLPDAEGLWLHLASQLETWNLDDAMAPRYQQVLKRFQAPGLWDAAARWYARRSYHAELRQLATDVTSRFRGSALFQRAGANVTVAVPEQPPVGTAVRMVLWADWVRLRALERFPHSPQVFKEAGRLVTPAQWQARFHPADEARKRATAVIVPEALLEERRWAILFADPAQREAWFGEAMRKGALEGKLTALEGRADRTPVEDLLLFEGWARLSRFERAVAPAEHLTRQYPGDEALALQLLSLHRSLNTLEASHAAPARALVERTAPALENPNPLWTQLGEMEEDRGHGAEALPIWRNLLAREPRDPARIAELATLLWDYGHDREALAVVEAGRKALGRPRFYAFETGVLRENLRDLDGAVREYLDATRPETPGRSYFSYESDQRSLRRLAQLLSRDRVYAMVAGRIKALAPGRADDERTLAAFWTLGTIEQPDPGLSWDADLWIDALDQPSDPLGREERRVQKEARRPGSFTAIRRLRALMLDKALAMVPQATASGFLDFTADRPARSMQEDWTRARAMAFQAAVMARRAQLATDEEQGIRLEMERATYLAGHGLAPEADAVWAALAPRLDRLPEGSLKLRAESQRAGYLERSKGLPAAAEEWRRITARHPWSLGLLEDRLAFLDRAKLGEEARALLEATAPRAAAGHRENLLEQLTRTALAASDLPRARRAATRLLEQDQLEDARRLGAIHLMARVAFREDPAWDALPLAKTQSGRLKPELQADLYRELARAADLERSSGPGATLWIEALNRRPERDWLTAAGRSCQRSGKGAELLAFFEGQRQRSPRDVRWAVAVRELRRFGHDVDGALEAAKAAVAVRPELEQLWRDAAELLVRADRVREAADFLEGWNRPRQASEAVARWRGELYARAGDGERALAVEQDTLQALAREGLADAGERQRRRNRAAGRLADLGRPDLAVRLYTAKGEMAALARAPELPVPLQVRLALHLGRLGPLLSAYGGDADRLGEAGAALLRYGKPEHRDELQAWLLTSLFPATATQGDNAALRRWWPFITAAGLEPSIRAALGQRLLAVKPGPWQAGAPFTFARGVGQTCLRAGPARGEEPGAMAFREPDLAALWAVDLARQGRGADLVAFVEPHWQDLLAQVRGQAPLDARSRRLPWTQWLDDRTVLAAWAQVAAGRPDKLRELSEVMAERRLWDRFWTLGARAWSAEILVAVLPEAPRAAWFRFWSGPVPADPALRARQGAVERVGNLMARLVQGSPGAGADELLDKLRGPRTVGEVLGQDSRWTWPEFSPRQDDQGEDRVTGQGVDHGRVPGALWGERPGEAWYVLEALARYRQGDRTAPYLPLNAPQRGGETTRTLLAMRLAKAMGDLPLALAIEAGNPGPAKDRAWLEGRLSLLVAAARRDDATAAFRLYVRAVQGELTEATFKELALLATRLGLASPMDYLDPAQPVGPVFLAYLQDQRPQSARALRTANPVDYRTALSRRWAAKEDRLTRAQAQYWLRELWATGSTHLPPKVLGKVGPVWARAWTWLNATPVPDRPGAIAALEAALNPTTAEPALLAQLAAPGGDDANRLLAVRLRLARRELAPALALVDTMLAATGPDQTLDYHAVPAPGDGDAAPEAEAPSPSEATGVNRLEAWLEPFREAGQARPVEERFLKALAQLRQEGTLSPQAWRLAFRLTPPAAQAALAQELEQAWFRGEVEPAALGTILETAAPGLGAGLPRWLSRWPQVPIQGEAYAFDRTRLRVAILTRAKQPVEAARVLLAARGREPWTARQEALAFDLWRTLGAGVKGPEYWQGARAVWSGTAPLLERLKAHPHDVLAARAALRSLGPQDEGALARAALILTTDRPWARDLEGDLQILQVRAARGLLPQAPTAAALALGAPEPEALAQLLTLRRFKPADSDAALADLARLATRVGQDGIAQGFLGVLTDRGAPELKALLAERSHPPGKAEAFRMDQGRPVPLRPRDLTWAMLTNVLNKEGAL